MKHNDTTYQPISCAEYSRYEVAILHNEHLRLCWKDPNNLLHMLMLIPFDLQTKKGGEYLLGNDKSGQSYQIRLDYIQRCEVI